MVTTTRDRSDSQALAAPAVELQLRSSRLLTIVAILAMVVGFGSVFGGIAGATYTYRQASVENIVTPDDAVFAEVAVRGPVSMWAQSDIITQHQLDRTEGLRFSEMPRQVPMVDAETGEVVVDETTGEPVMIDNQLRQSWISATSLTTALGLGILAYALSAFAIVVGLTLGALGLVVMRLRRSTAAFA